MRYAVALCGVVAATFLLGSSAEADVAGLRIHDIQGAGHVSPYNGQTVSAVPGIVTAKRSNGFWMQETDFGTDANEATSEGIFVFTSSAPLVSLGDSVNVTGVVSEVRPGGAGSSDLTLTELTSPIVSVLSTGNSLPSAVAVGTGGRVPPSQLIENDATGDVETSGVFDPANDGIDFWESLEEMRVQVNDAVAVGPAQLGGGSGDELPVVGDNGTNASVFTPRGGLIQRATDANPERIILNDLVVGGPTLPSADVGDSFPGATEGVVDYSVGNFKLEVTSLPAKSSGGLARESTSTPGADELAVATLDANDLSVGDPQSTFDALAGQIVSNLRSPDLLSVEQVEDDSGTSDDGTVGAGSTLAKLVTAIQAAGGPTYVWRQVDPVDDADGGSAGGNIRQVFLFRTDRGLGFVDAPGAGSTTANSVVTGPHLQYSPGRIDPINSAFNGSRKPLAGEFTFHGTRLFAVANHFNDRSTDQPLFGHFQPPTFSSETQRAQQAQVVNDFVDAMLAADPSANVIVLGDLNDFDYSTALATLQGSPAALTNLYSTVPAAERYSYVLDGNSQALDHILASSHLAATLAAFDPVHANSEFASRSADHDPLVARFTLPWPVVSAADKTVTETNAGNNTTIAFTVSLSRASTTQATVAYATTDGTAKAPGDYTAKSGTVTFNPGETTKTVNVSVIGDNLNEADETLSLALSSPVNATLGSGATGTIADNDAAVLSVNNPKVNEGSGGTSVNATFTIKLPAASGQTITVDYATADVTAISPADYAAKSGTLTFAPGALTQTVTVVVAGDDLNEATETFRLDLSNATGRGVSIGDALGVGTILDNDPTQLSVSDASIGEGNSGTTTMTFTISLSRLSSRTVTVNRGTASGSALQQLDYTGTSGTATIPAGSSSTTVSVPLIGDTLNEADETFFVNLRSPAVATIADEQGVGTIVNDDPAPTAPPTISGFSPTSGPTGTVVTVTGTNFTGTNTVTFNGKSAMPKVQSATKLTVPAANGATTGKITVTNVVGTGTSASSFTVTLSLTNFSPNSGPVGTMVTVNGVGFNSSSIVVFKDGVTAPTTFVSPTQLQATVPPGAVPGTLRVTNTDAPVGTVQSRGTFAVL